MLRIPWEGKPSLVAADPPARNPCVWVFSLPRSCGARCSHFSVAWGSPVVWVRPALSEKVLPSLAIFWKGLGGLSRMVPSSRTSRACSVYSPVYRGPRLPAPSLGGNHAGQSLSVVPPLLRSCCVVSVVWWWLGKGPRVRGAPFSFPREGCRGVGCGKATVGSRVPAVSRSSPVPSVTCVPPARVHDLGCSRDAAVCCVWCVPCALGLCAGCRVVPASPAAAFPRLAELWECPPPTPWGRGCLCLA